MNKIFYFTLVLTVAFVGYRLFVAKAVPPSSSVTDMVLFWGEGCSHCENVKKYIQDNRIDKSLKIDQKEVYYNRANQKEMEQVVLKCPEIDPTQGVGVPLAWISSESKCLIGDQPIISWLQQKLLK